MAEDYDCFNDTFDSYNNTPTKCNISLNDLHIDFQKIRINALTKAAEISPLVREVTIGPNSPIKKVLEAPERNVKVKAKVNLKYEEDVINNDLQYTAAIKEYEFKFQEKSEIIFMNLIDKMISNRSETTKQFWKKQTEDYEQKALDFKAKKLQMLQLLQENDNLSILEQAKQDEKNCQYINTKTIENMKLILEEQNKATARFASITDSQTKIFLCYNEISNILLTDDYAKKVSQHYVTSINTVIENVNNIMDICKNGTISDKEVKQAEILVQNIENLKKIILTESTQLRQDIIKKQQEEIEKAQKIKDEEQKKIAEKQETVMKEIKPSSATIKTMPMFYSSKNYERYNELKAYLLSYESQYQDLLQSTTLKKYRFDCQKAVNTPVNAISSVSGIHMKDKYDKLAKLLRGERVQVLDIIINGREHPQGLSYCTALLAKKIVRQGDLLVSSNPEAAFPLASIAVALWSQFPELGMLLEANFNHECPYLVPMFLPQMKGQSDKEFYKSRGYTYNDEGVVEKQDKFLKRMSGIFRLMCAIWISKTPKHLNAVNPHGLQHGWRWLASFVNLKPEPDICATLLYDFFTVCGSEFLKYYGKQFIKIIRLITTEYLAILEKIDEGGPKTRLEVLLQNILKTGHIPPPSGLLSSNVW